MNFGKCLFWTVLFLMKPFGETFSVSTRDAIMAQAPTPQESWFEKFVEYVTGKYPILFRDHAVFWIRLFRSKRHFYY